MKGGQIAHHLIVLLGFVGMNGLSMLPKIVETGELLAAVAGEWAFASVFTVSDEDQL